MVKRMTRRLVEDFPEYAELHDLLTLAATTWPLFGISAGELAEMDGITLEIVRLASRQ
jgi:hypothetical protein